MTIAGYIILGHALAIGGPIYFELTRPFNEFVIGVSLLWRDQTRLEDALVAGQALEAENKLLRDLFKRAA